MSIVGEGVQRQWARWVELQLVQQPLYVAELLDVSHTKSRTTCTHLCYTDTSE
jgi:hypothetical protein